MKWRPLTIAISDRVREDLEDLVTLGLYGLTIENVVERLVDARVRDFVRQGRLPMHRSLRGGDYEYLPVVAAFPPLVRRRRSRA